LDERLKMVVKKTEREQQCVFQGCQVLDFGDYIELRSLGIVFTERKDSDIPSRGP